ncbi:hypothetical protein K2P47_03465 [Patescibacteria group bacterium]|nr:hypothetical protein [Patescibacteria group bacterium]
MKRYCLLFPVILCSLLLQIPSATAQTTTASTTVTAPGTTTVTPPRRPFIAEPTLQRIAQTRLTNLAANMSNRMDSAVARLQNVTDRLSSRLTKMEAEGKDVSAARTELALAQTKLDEAKRRLATIDTEVNAFVGSATPRENWVNLRNTYLTTREVIVAAHQSILATINLAQNTTVPAPETVSTSSPATNN